MCKFGKLHDDPLFVCLPESWPQDPVADDKVKFLQVGCGTIFQHAVAMKTVLTIIKALGDLKSIRLHDYLNLSVC